MRQWLLLLTIGGAVAQSATVNAQMPLENRAAMPAAVMANPDVDASTILERAHAAAGGENFVRPGTLYLEGYNMVHRGTQEWLWDDYRMWRVFADEKGDAHAVNGKIRIEARSGGELVFLNAYDGQTSYNADGPVPSEGSVPWSDSFGFGAIRHALDDGWTRERRVDRMIDGQPTYMIALKDPSGGDTLFGIRQSDHAIVYVGFQTSRGWHERRYSDFFTKPGVPWQQAGRVRLFYNGEKANEAVWTDFDIGASIDDAVFVVPAGGLR